MGPALDLERKDVVLVVAGHRHSSGWRRHPRGNHVEPLTVLEERLVSGVAFEKRGDDCRRGASSRHLLQQLAIGLGPLELTLEDLAKDLTTVGELYDSRLDSAPDQEPIEILLVLDVSLGATALGAKEGRLRNVDGPTIDELGHLPIEEREQQRPNVRAVDVGVGHDDDAVIAEFLDIEVLAADSAPERRDHRLDLVAAQHLVEACFLDVENLAFDRQDRLEPAVATLF